jgi:hypothetical protein
MTDVTIKIFYYPVVRQVLGQKGSTKLKKTEDVIDVYRGMVKCSAGGSLGNSDICFNAAASAMNLI